MKITHLLASAGLLAAVTAASFAQVGSRPQISSEVAPPDKGTAEVGISLNAKLDKPSNEQLNLRYLPYISRQLQLGADLTYNHSSGFNGGFIEFRGDYNFVPAAADATTISRTVPYAGLGIGAAYGDNTGSDYGAQIGLKHFITNDVSLFGEINYRHFSKEQSDNGSKKNITRLLIGLNTYLR